MIFYDDYLHDLYERIPEATRGNFSIVRDELPKGTIMRTYHPSGIFYRDMLIADYPFIRLTEEGTGTWMTDTPMEQEGMIIPALLAHGKVLMIGLGLGLFLIRTRKFNRMIDKITIIERSPEVAKLVYRHISSRKEKLIVCDGEEYLSTCKEKYDYIYIDVWDNTTTPIGEIDRWSKLAQRCITPSGTVRCWLQELYDRIKDKLPKEPVTS